MNHHHLALVQLQMIHSLQKLDEFCSCLLLKRFKVWIQILIEFHSFPQMQVTLDLRQSAQLVNYMFHEEVGISGYDVGFGTAVVDSHSACC